MPNLAMCGQRTLVAKSCTKCNLLKLASEFGKPRDRHGYESYDSWCKVCNTRITSEINRRANDASLEKATHYRDRWTSDDLETLQRLIRLGLSHLEIATRLGRTRSAVYTMAAKLREAEDFTGVRLFYYEATTNSVRQVGKPYDLSRKGSERRLNRAAQELSELHTQLIFFIEVDEGGEYMGIRGLDALKEGDDREPEDSAPDKEHAPPPEPQEQEPTAPI